ncbi:hypothetical protein ACM66B_005394 [Microbotryomycetes sp. NB124-2]
MPSTTYPYKAIATLKYKSPPGSPVIQFAKGQSVIVTGQADDEGDWLEGHVQDTGDKGVFPSSFVEKVEQEEDPATAQETSEGPHEASSPPAEPVVDSARPEPEAPSAALAAQPVPVTSPSKPSDAEPATAAAADARPSSPPDTPKKPSSLRDRIAALNAAGAQPAAPPPVPRSSKPFVFKKPVVSSSDTPSNTTLSQTTTSTTVSPPSQTTTLSASSTSGADEKATTTNKAFSAEDARESIGKGGSLKDRIAALQGMTLDTPVTPGRAPKPWKKKSVDVQEEEQVAGEEQAQAVSKEVPAAEVEGQVKDERPDEVETTAQSESAHVPGFEPAEEEDETAGIMTSTEERKPEAFVAQPLDENDNMNGTAPTPCDPNFEEATTATAAAQSQTSVEPKTEDAGLEDEKDKRAAIAARMAGLGGQRVGMAMPALPKRAGPPRRKPAAAAAAAASSVEVSDDLVETSATKANDEREPETAQSASTAPATATGAAVGVVSGASWLAAAKESQDDDNDEVNEDDFDTPALPKSSPPAKLAPAPPVEQSQDDETELEPVEPAEPELADDEAEPSSETKLDEVAGVPPPLPVGRPPLPPPMTSDADDSVEDLPNQTSPTRPVLRSGTDEVDPGVTEASPPPISPLAAGRPPIPVVPQSFSTPHQESQQDELLAAAAERDVAIAPTASGGDSTATEEVPSPVSPPPGRPAIPAIPATFASTTVTDHAAENRPIEIPRGEPLVVENDVSVDDVAEDGGPVGDEGEESGQQADVEDETPPPPPPPGRPAPPINAESIETTDRETTEPAELAETETQQQDEEQEEEDPEIARRRAIAARMAKLGGMNMRMGPMIPPIGGVRRAPPVKKQSEDDANDEDAVERADSRQVEEEAAAPPPPRRIPGFPVGGFALPGIVPVRPPPAAAAADEEEDEDTDEAQRDAAPRAEVEAESELASAPPPLPTSRPPVPALATRDAEDEAGNVTYSASSPPPVPAGRPPVPASEIVDEPEQLEVEDPALEQDEDENAPPPPPPPRPSGGLPPPPSTGGSPLAQAPAVPDETPSSPVNKSTGFGLFKPKSRQGSVPSIEPVTSRTSLDAPSRSSFEGGQVYRSNSVQSGSAGASKALPSVNETTTSSSTSNYDVSQLVQYSTTLGAQVFAAAHTKLSARERLGGGGEGLLEVCLSRAAGARMPSEHVYGEVVLHIEGGNKSNKNGVLREVDEPRAGDVVVFHDTKFKHNLTTTRVGSAQAPFVCVVASWDSKKRKLKTIEVNNKDGQVEEGSHRLEDLKQGHVVVYRVVPDSV